RAIDVGAVQLRDVRRVERVGRRRKVRDRLARRGIGGCRRWNDLFRAGGALVLLGLRRPDGQGQDGGRRENEFTHGRSLARLLALPNETGQLDASSWPIVPSGWNSRCINALGSDCSRDPAKTTQSIDFAGWPSQF